MNKSQPMSTIFYPDPNSDRPYLSIIDADETVRIQIHRYDSIHPVWLVFDKKAIPDLINALEKFL
jgi:hypothetical protein